MNGSEAIHAAIMESLAAQRSFIEEALEDARTGATVRAELRAAQERGRLPNTASEPGGARGPSNLPAGRKASE